MRAHQRKAETNVGNRNENFINSKSFCCCECKVSADAVEYKNNGGEKWTINKILGKVFGKYFLFPIFVIEIVLR